MKKNESPYQVEPERYEMSEPPAYKFAIDRRKFFKVLGGGVAIAFVLNDVLGLATDDLELALQSDDQIGAWLHINEKSKVTIYTGKVEVGQNIRTSLAQIVAEELNVPISSIDMILGDTYLTPYDRGTFGSRSIPIMGMQLRKAAASARELLLSMAAKEWKVEVEGLTISDGKIVNPRTQQSIEIGSLVKGKELLDNINNDVKVTPTKDWKIAGTSVGKVNGESYVTGSHRYVSDMKLPDMLFGKVLRAPSYGATLESVDLSKTKSFANVVSVHDGNFIGVAATDPLLATEALKQIKTTWKTSTQPSRQEIFDYLKKNEDPGRDRSDKDGNVKQALAEAYQKVDQTFNVDYIAHVPLEPRAAVAQWTDDKLTVWLGTQRPFGVQEDLQEAFRIPKENIRVIVPDTGSGYGGKHSGEVAIEAARLAKAAQKPVKLVWTREEEFTWAYFRPGGVIEVKAGVSSDGTINAWEFHNYNSGGAGIETPYTVSNKHIQFHSTRSPLRQGSYRGLAATANVFARESIMDDLAAMLNMDPLEFRLKNLKDERLTAVLKEAASVFGWNQLKPSKNRGFGIGCGIEKGSYIATCAEIMIDYDIEQVKVVRVVAAYECGAIINPNHLHNQVEGAIIQGIGGALFEYIDFKDGKILNPSLSKYRVPRFKDTPKLQIVTLDRKDLPSVGAGETPILGIAPAIRNAIFNATGKKLYSLPLVPNGWQV